MQTLDSGASSGFVSGPLLKMGAGGFRTDLPVKNKKGGGVEKVESFGAGQAKHGGGAFGWHIPVVLSQYRSTPSPLPGPIRLSSGEKKNAKINPMVVLGVDVKLRVVFLFFFVQFIKSVR